MNKFEVCPHDTTIETLDQIIEFIESNWKSNITTVVEYSNGSRDIKTQHIPLEQLYCYISKSFRNDLLLTHNTIIEVNLTKIKLHFTHLGDGVYRLTFFKL